MLVGGEEKSNRLYILFGALYVLVIIYITCLSRITTFSSQVAPYPLWAYVSFFRGNWSIGLQIVENIILFIPLGYWIRALCLKKNRIIIGGLILSVCIELSQLYFHLGLFEIDDILHNSVGTLLGILICDKLKISSNKRLIGSGIVIFCSILFCVFMPKAETSISEQSFYFGIESVNVVANEINLSGYCFAYEKPDERYALYLQSDNEVVRLNAITEQPSKQINKYFECSEDYSKTYFIATATINPRINYEMFVKWDNDVVMSTGTYICDEAIEYTSNAGPDFPGTLLVSRPEYDFYVYQNAGDLFWLCGEKFPFEDDGTTYIQYQLWTTQPELLPEERLAHEWFWDNVGFDFEKYEINGVNGYRVARRPIPTEYSITSIVTGYYKEGKWIWKDYFRPIVFNLSNFQERLAEE